MISSLLTGASSYLKTDSGFSLLDFAPEMKALTGSNLSLATLPDAAVQNIYIPAFGNQLQDANYIYVPDIQRMVNAGFYGSAAVKPAKSVTVDVYNGSGAPGLAGDAAQAFASQGYTAGKAANASAQSQPVQDDTQVFYGAGAAANAESIADEVGAMTAGGALGATALPSLPAGHVEVLLGSTVTALPAGLETYGGSTVTAQDFTAAAQQDHLPASELPPASATAGTQSVSSALSGARPQAPADPATKPAAKPSAGSTSPASDDQAVAANARFGIPCVYRPGSQAVQAVNEVHPVRRAAGHEDHPDREEHRADRHAEVSQERQVVRSGGQVVAVRKCSAMMPNAAPTTICPASSARPATRGCAA